MSQFVCPVCGLNLTEDEKTYSCPSGHSFDKSKYGYVNLLMSQQSSDKRHGDDKLMVRSRKSFLDKGYYSRLSRAVCDSLNKSLPCGGVLYDIGCGEGYYTSFLSENSKAGAIYGIDISKDALAYASKRNKNVHLAVASAFSLPFGDKTADAVVNIFAPCAYSEFSRVLKEDGVLIKAVPLSEHLWELKQTLYDEPYKNKPELRDDKLFELLDFCELKYNVKLSSGEDIFELFTMTPYYYKTSEADAKKLLSKNELDVTLHFGIETYRKRKQNVRK